MSDNNIDKFIQYNESVRYKMLDIVKPLKDIFDIKFHCSRIYMDGLYFDLGHEIDFLKKSYTTDLMSKGTFFINELHNFDSVDNPTSLWPSTPTDPYLEWLYDCNMWQGFEIYERKKSYVQIWTFMAGRSKGNMGNFYFQNINMLKEFIFYFKEKGSFLFDSIDRKYLPYSEVYKNFFSDQVTKICSKKIEFKEKINIKKYHLSDKDKDYIISKREAQCLACLSSGKTSKESAKILDISPRTVEENLKNLKIKLECETTSNLIKIFLENPIKLDFF